MTTNESPAVSSASAVGPVEMAWFSALCDDDYEFLGVPDPQLASSFEHCRNITLTADRYGFDNILLPSGYALGIDNTAFAAAMGPMTSLRMPSPFAVANSSCPSWPVSSPPSTRSSTVGWPSTSSRDVPGEVLDSEPRYRRSTEIMYVLRELLDGRGVDPRRSPRSHHRAASGPHRVREESAVRFGGLSPQRERRCRRRRVPDVARYDREGARGQSRHGRPCCGQGPIAALRMALPRDRPRDRGRGPRCRTPTAVQARRRDR
ncbi:MAG: hypothetical protein R2710_12495 [Acidimicrobiales bacterium]